MLILIYWLILIVVLLIAYVFSLRWKVKQYKDLANSLLEKNRFGFEQYLKVREELYELKAKQAIVPVEEHH